MTRVHLALFTTFIVLTLLIQSGTVAASQDTSSVGKVIWVYFEAYRGNVSMFNATLTIMLPPFLSYEPQYHKPVVVTLANFTLNKEAFGSDEELIDVVIDEIVLVDKYSRVPLATILGQPLISLLYSGEHMTETNDFRIAVDPLPTENLTVGRIQAVYTYSKFIQSSGEYKTYSELLTVKIVRVLEKTYTT